MNTLNKFRFVTLFFCCISTTCLSFTDRDTATREYSLVIYGGSGISFFASAPAVPAFIDDQTTRVFACHSLRMMWHPDHLLRVGLETGIIPLYSYKIQDDQYSGELQLTSIPVLLIWSMRFTKRLNAFVGYGYFRLVSKLNYAGKTKSAVWNTGWAAALSYDFPLSRELNLSLESKWMESERSKNTALIMQLQLCWKFYKW